MSEATAIVPVPALPYRVEMMRYGVGEGVEHPTKVYLNNKWGGAILTDDEKAVWAYLQHVTAERDAAEAEIKRLVALMGTDNCTPDPEEPKPAPPAEKKGKVRQG